MKKYISVYLFLLSTCFSYGQITFEKIYSGGNSKDAGLCVQQTTDSGYIIAGYHLDGHYRGYMIKTDKFGDTMWTRKYYDDNRMIFQSVVQSNDGGYVCTGDNWVDFPYGDLFILKTNSEGDTIWTKKYGGDETEAGIWIQNTIDNGYIIVGNANQGSGNSDVYLLRTDENGDTLWTRIFNKYHKQYASYVEQTNDTGYIIVGTCKVSPYAYGEKNDLLFIKTNKYGDTIWNKSYDIEYNEVGKSIHRTSDDGYIISGSVFDSINDYLFLLKLNSSGDTMWKKYYGGNNTEWGGFSQIAEDGGYILVGRTRSFEAWLQDVYLIKTDVNGNVEWSNIFGGALQDFGRTVELTNDGGYIIVGDANYNGSDEQDVYLIKTDQEGMVLWTSDLSYSGSLKIFTRPNPFTTYTTVSYSLDEPSTVILSIFNSQGKLIEKVKQEQAGGEQQLIWNAKGLPAGMYYFRIQADGKNGEGKMLLMR